MSKQGWREFKALDRFFIKGRGVSYIINMKDNNVTFEELECLRENRTRVRIGDKVGSILGWESPAINGCIGIMLNKPVTLK